MHSNTRKRPYNETQRDKAKRIKEFIEQFTENYATPLPGRLPMNKDYQIMLFPQTCLKVFIKACEREQECCVYISCRTLKNINFGTVIPPPATDLCHTCQQNANLPMKSANVVPDVLKSQRLQDSFQEFQHEV